VEGEVMRVVTAVINEYNLFPVVLIALIRPYLRSFRLKGTFLSQWELPFFKNKQKNVVSLTCSNDDQIFVATDSELVYIYSHDGKLVKT